MTLDSGRRTTEIRRGMRKEKPLWWQHQNEEWENCHTTVEMCARKGREVTQYE